MKEPSGKNRKEPSDKSISDSPNYTEAFEELQSIVSEIEGGEISVDELSEKVKRAAILIQICRSKLTATEGDVNKILQQLDSPETSTDEKQA